jgi:tetratricopeptide (TPR) repeat protein
VAWIARNDNDRGIADFTAAIRLAPEFTAAYYRRGLARYDNYMRAAALIDKNDLDGAIADFTDAIRLDPNDADAYYARGLAWSTNGDRDHAIADLTEAVQLRPYSPQMIAALKQLKPDTPDHTVITPESLKRFLETH